MTDQHLILTHWKKEQKVFDTNFSILKKQTDSEAIHDIRVAVKKLRAFLKLYSLLKKEPESEHLLNKTEELFAVLGRQREIEICTELISQYEKENNRRYTELTEYLKLLLRKTKRWVNQSIHAYHKKELPKISLALKEDKSLKDEEALIQNIQAIVNACFLEIKDHFKQPHKVRQKLKTVYYWIPILPENVTGATSDASKLHHILDDLGKWQDHEVLLTRIRHFRKDYLPKSFEEATSIKTLEEKLKTKKQELRKSALNKARRLLKKASAVKNE